jgi:Xaa-Pro aminopeptidase
MRRTPIRRRSCAYLRTFNLAGKTLGVSGKYGLTARNGMRLSAALDGFADLQDASDLVSRLRLVKSPAEIAYVREAAKLADLRARRAHRLTKPGADEGEILARAVGHHPGRRRRSSQRVHHRLGAGRPCAATRPAAASSTPRTS